MSRMKSSGAAVQGAPGEDAPAGYDLAMKPERIQLTADLAMRPERIRLTAEPTEVPHWIRVSATSRIQRSYDCGNFSAALAFAAQVHGTLSDLDVSLLLDGPRLDVVIEEAASPGAAADQARKIESLWSERSGVCSA